MKEEKIKKIIKTYNTDEVKISTAYGDGGVDGLWPRFERAASNQISEGPATVSRYAIWANTVRDNTIFAMECMRQCENEKAIKHLIRVINSLSAFSDLQKELDPFDL